MYSRNELVGLILVAAAGMVAGQAYVPPLAQGCYAVGSVGIGNVNYVDRIPGCGAPAAVHALQDQERGGVPSPDTLHGVQLLLPLLSRPSKPPYLGHQQRPASPCLQ